MAWKVKLEEDGKVTLKDGIPVWIDEESQREGTFNVNELHSKILNMGREAQKQKDELSALKERLAPVAEIEDLTVFLEESKKAQDTLKNLEEKDVRKAETVEKIKQEMRDGFASKETEIRREYDKKLGSVQSDLDKSRGQIRQLMIDAKFDACNLFSGPEPRTLMTSDAARSLFGQHFELEEVGDGKPPRVIGRHLNGEPVYSRENVGELADFEEAIQQIWERYPHKERYLRSKGGGTSAGGGTSQVPAGKGTSLAALIKARNEATDPLQIISYERHIAEAKKRQSQ